MDDDFGIYFSFIYALKNHVMQRNALVFLFICSRFRDLILIFISHLYFNLFYFIIHHRLVYIMCKKIFIRI